MNNIEDLLRKIKENSSCLVKPRQSMPIVPSGLILPNDLESFYQTTGGMILFKDALYSIDIVAPERFVRANPIIVGKSCEDDRSYDWFIIGQSEQQYITIDLNSSRIGKCYDSFWDRHGVPGECPVIALSFTELIDSLYQTKGGYWYWLKEDFESLGDAYD